jgi:hypothetical protein
MNGMSGLELAIITWGVVTVMLIGLAIHRSILGFREEDHIFVEGEGKILQSEQTDALQRIARLDPWLARLLWLSGALLLLAAAVWLYPGISALLGG